MGQKKRVSLVYSKVSRKVLVVLCSNQEQVSTPVNVLVIFTDSHPAIWGLPGYTFMGIHKEVRKLFGSSFLNYMISARTAQGYEDFQSSTPEERLDIIERWKRNKADIRSPKQNSMDGDGHDRQTSGHRSPKGFLQTRHMTFDERDRLQEERNPKRDAERTKIQSANGHRNCPFCRRDKPHSHNPRPVQTMSTIPSRSQEEEDGETTAEFERAIQDSVAATSHGDPEEDLMIERAIRASVRELQNSSVGGLSDQEAMNRAVQASIAEAGRSRVLSPREEEQGLIELTDEDEAHQRALEKAIQESLSTYRITASSSSQSQRGRRDPKWEAHGEGEGKDVDTDDDENVKLAIQQSRLHKVTSADDMSDDAEDVKLAIQKIQGREDGRGDRAAVCQETEFAGGGTPESTGVGERGYGEGRCRREGKYSG